MLKQQGDVLFEKVEKVEGRVIKHDGILAKGEVTGHCHKIDIKDIQTNLVEFIDKDGILYVKAKGNVIVKHEEHKPITLTPGIWKVSKVKEKDHLLNETREVRD